MKLNKYEYKEKDFVELVRRRNELWAMKRRVPKRKLKEPFQDGWTLKIHLTDEAFRRLDGPRMHKVVEMVTIPYTTRDSAKISKIRKERSVGAIKALFTFRDKDGNISYHGPHTTHIKHNEWEKLDRSLQKLFYRTEHHYVSRWGGATYVDIRYTVDIPEQYLEVTVKKRMIHELQDIDPDLEKEHSWVEAQLEEYYRTGGGYSRDIDDTRRKIRRHTKDATKKILKGEIEEAEEYSKLSRHKLKS